MSDKSYRHWDDESLEMYSFGRLGEPRTEMLEEHLLICEPCRARLDETEKFMRAMSRGSQILQQQTVPGRLEWITRWFEPAWVPVPAAAWAGAAAFSICAILLISTATRHRGQTAFVPVAMSLSARRGLTSARGAPRVVPANRPLSLHLETLGIDATDKARVVLVDATGNKVQEKIVPFQSSGVDFQTNPLQPGSYYVRILKPDSSEPTREFALDVR